MGTISNSEYRIMKICILPVFASSTKSASLPTSQQMHFFQLLYNTDSIHLDSLISNLSNLSLIAKQGKVYFNPLETTREGGKQGEK